VSAPRVPVKNAPGIYKRGSRYSFTFTDHLGRQRYGSAATLAEAKRAKAAKTADVARGEFRDLSKATVTEYAAKWIARYKGRTRRGINADTLADYRGELGLDGEGNLTGRGFLAFAGRLRMVDVTPADILDYAATLEARGLARNTVRLSLAPVKAMFASAVEDTTIRWNPTAVRINAGAVAEVDEDGEEAKALTREQLDALFEELPVEWLPFFEVLAEYGLRCGEAIELRGKDVEVADGDVIGGLLHVRRRYYRGRVASPKAGSRRQLRLEAGRARQLRAMAADPEALLFPAEKGGRIEPSNLMSRVLKPAAVRAGIGEWAETANGRRASTWVGFHTFRHTCATLKLREEGWSLEQVQVFLGHASYQTTARFYAHLVSTDAPVPAPIRGGRGGQSVASRPPQTTLDTAALGEAETA
jgi:integrase